MAPKKTGSRRKRTEADDDLPAADAPTQPLEPPPPDPEPEPEPEPEPAAPPPPPPAAAKPKPDLCGACSGNGLIDGARCQTCGGTGRPPTPKRRA